MRINQIRLRSFRNYRSLDLDLPNHINLFLGDNAQGKTNLLEAVYLLATGKSFRSTKDTELIFQDHPATYIRGTIVRDATITLDFSINTDSQKKLLVNSKTAKPKDFIGHLNVVLFTPDDLQLIKGSPSDRRRFLDMEICQVNPMYRNLLADYQRIITQRNHLLKEIAHAKGNKDLLAVFGDSLIDLGSRIMAKRSEVINRLGLLSRLVHRKISNGLEELELAYRPFFVTSTNKLRAECDSPSFFAAELQEALKKSRQEELARGYTTVGPHRDDLSFLVNGLDARIYGSQGQQRTAILACRLAEVEFMRSETGRYPVILLDDVMSELDNNRRAFLLQLLSTKVQTVITTTDLADFSPEILDYATLRKVKNGAICAS